MQHFSPADFVVPGALIDDRYLVGGLLGTGGMGWVVQAYDLKLNRHPVAVKILLPHLVTNQTSYLRFCQEVLLSMRLSHPNIVQTYRSGALGDLTYYLVMEYVSGQTLKSRLAEHSSGYPLDELFEILRCIAGALTYAHEAGLVHRDIKPDNVILDAERNVKIADFGIAQVLRQEARVTRIGELIGTPVYMSPEQFRGELIDARADIYSFGVMAFELCCRRPPFEGHSILELAEQHCSRPAPRLGTLRSEVPDWFEDLIAGCLEKQREERFQSMRDVVQILAERLGKSADLVASGAKIMPRPEAEESQLISRFLKLVNVAVPLLGITFMLIATAHFSRVQVGWNARLSRRLVLLEQTFGTRLDWLRNVLSVELDQGDRRFFFTPEAASEVQAMLELGADPNFLDAETGLTPLHFWVMQTGDSRAPVVSALLGNGARTETQDTQGYTALHRAIDAGTEKAVELLLAAGADPDRLYPGGQLPRERAKILGRRRVAEILEEHSGIRAARSV